ncbi:hypothetical protein BJ508DRAFT_315695 [Ascobolus immersus RN42]|uniref:Uncharacterized protein n=1 Tax=Ascobolus immersus RN42 TaxID=1160509 RepID=A0A3N4HC85_ASCIM|nr:hypothetical protein BJ508DRAFT_315695 [Ascobolus immersus RN42]
MISRPFLSRVLSHVKTVECAPVPYRGINDVTPSSTNQMVKITCYVPGDRRIVDGRLIDHRDRYAGIVRYFLIVPELFCDMIIGTDTQLATGMTIDLYHMSLSIRACAGITTSLRILPKRQANVKWRVDSADNDVVIPPASQFLVPVHHKPLPPGIPLEFTPVLSSALMKTLTINGGFHRALIDHCSYALLFSNTSTKPLTIPRNSRLGYVQVLTASPSQIFEITSNTPEISDDFTHRASLTADPAHPEAPAPAMHVYPLAQAQAIAAVVDQAAYLAKAAPSTTTLVPRGEMPPPLPDAPSQLICWLKG